MPDRCPLLSTLAADSLCWLSDSLCFVMSRISTESSQNTVLAFLQQSEDWFDFLHLLVPADNSGSSLQFGCKLLSAPVAATGWLWNVRESNEMNPKLLPALTPVTADGCVLRGEWEWACSALLALVALSCPGESHTRRACPLLQSGSWRLSPRSGQGGQKGWRGHKTEAEHRVMMLVSVELFWKKSIKLRKTEGEGCCYQKQGRSGEKCNRKRRWWKRSKNQRWLGKTRMTAGGQHHAYDVLRLDGTWPQGLSLPCPSLGSCTLLAAMSSRHWSMEQPCLCLAPSTIHHDRTRWCTRSTARATSAPLNSQSPALGGECLQARSTHQRIGVKLRPLELIYKEWDGFAIENKPTAASLH